MEVPGSSDDQNTNEGINTTTNAGGAAAATTNIQQDVPVAAPPPERNKETNITPEEAVMALQVESNQAIIKHNHLFVSIRNQTVSRLELEATRNVYCSI